MIKFSIVHQKIEISLSRMLNSSQLSPAWYIAVRTNMVQLVIFKIAFIYHGPLKYYD